MSTPQRYLVLPARGLQATADNSSTAVRTFLIELAVAGTVPVLRKKLSASLSGGGQKKKRLPNALGAKAFQLIASLAEDGVKLFSATPEMAAALRLEQPGLRVVPERFYRPALFWAEIKKAPAKAHSAAASLKRSLVVEVVRADTQDPVKGAEVVGFTDFAARVGDGNPTNAQGKATLTVPGNEKTYERLYVQHEFSGLWTHLATDISTQGTLRIELQPIDMSAVDSLRHFHDIGQDTAGQGVKVAVIDSGIALSHPDLVVAGGLGCVPDEPEDDWGPLGGLHGSHVAGIIAGRGQAPNGMRGIAPAVELRSYRVFGQSESSGSSFALVKAINSAVEDGCDLLNMSLGFDPDEATGLPRVDEALQEAIRKAHRKGAVVLAAAGNDGRKPVNYPAFDDMAIAVSAVGRKGTFPSTSSETGDVMPPNGTDANDFVAAFSNIGLEIDVAGAGVGVVSTIPDKGYLPLSGTSMACPAVTGVLARLLAQTPAVLNMARDSNRSDAIKKMLLTRAKTLGFQINLEGKGLPR